MTNQHDEALIAEAHRRLRGKIVGRNVIAREVLSLVREKWSPEDRFLAEVREMVAAENPHSAKTIRAGNWDDTPYVHVRLAYFRRGYEMAEGDRT